EKYRVGIISGGIFSCLTMIGYAVFLEYLSIWHMFLGVSFISSVIFPRSVSKFLHQKNG
ncbi:membrane protein, partial [methanotrophic bacterial endosymbiont of Bathymodiolus sp.]